MEHTTFTPTGRDFDTFAGKLIADRAADTGEALLWIVSDAHAPNLQSLFDLMRRYNGRQVRIRIEDIGQ